MTSFVGDDLTVELERYLRTAVEVCIAAAFVNFQGVALLKKFIEKTKNRPCNINFLLDEGFHPHPAARDAIVKELCSIPGAKVRIFNDADRRLHMKLYIFSSGNTVNVISGSHNPTGAGLTKNIEAGLLTSNRKAVREARDYFNKYWSEGIEASPNPDAYYRDPLFQMGQMVRHRTTQEYGVITGAPTPPNLRGVMWYYQVLWRAAVIPEEHPEKDLQAMTVVDGAATDVLLSGLTAAEDNEAEYLRALLRRKLITPVRDGLFSYMASRTDIVPYQFKPLLKILGSDSYRILIADEVGLGKTIEAGIIFTELKARLPKFKRALVICPTNLKSKWQDELESRFDEYFKLLSRDELLHALRRPDEECYGIVSYELLGTDDMISILKDVESPWDMLILDEAHHLRNKNKRHRAVAQLARRSTALVMLSATPINLGVQDLTHLLQVLLPYDYRDVDDVEFGHRLEPNRYLFAAVNAVEGDPQAALRELTTMERLCRHADRITPDPAYQRAKLLLTSTKTLSAIEVAQVRDDLTNLNTLANVITRTRKVDVGAATTREVVTYEAQFSDYEAELYRALTEFARRLASSGKRKGAKGNSLAVMMPQRQAASCLPAAVTYLKDVIRDRLLSPEEGLGEMEDLEEVAAESVAITDPGLLAAAQKIIVEFEALGGAFHDTKYDKLREFLQTRATIDGRLDKVIIFTSFRKTLAYLQTRLENDFGTGSTIEIHGDIQPLTERDDRRHKFEQASGPSILLSTEVGSEGLDMQFANKLVNYDLPWNPMRVEQRIGRIDRHGQIADKLLILNFAMSDTIEDNVVARLLQRVKVFHDSLGPLSQVVGDVVRKLRDDMLNSSLSQREREDRIRKYEQSLEINARAEERFSKQRQQLIGQDKNFTEEVREIQQNRRYVTADEVLRVVQLYCAEHPEASQQALPDGTHLLTLGATLRQDLTRELSMLSNLGAEKRKRYTQKLAAGSFHFTPDRAMAVKNKRLEFFTLHHPVVASIVAGWPATAKVVTGRFGGHSHDVSAGAYLLHTYYCEYQRTGLPPAVFLYNVAVDLVSGLPTMVGDQLYHGVMSGTLRSHAAAPELASDVVARAGQSVKQELTRQVNDTAVKLQREREALIRQQAEVIRTAVEKEIAVLSQRRSMTRDNRARDELTGQIEARKRELVAQLQGLAADPGDVVAKPVLVGVAWCLVEREDHEDA